jgi:hypothetical protein
MPNHVYARISISDPTKKQKEILKKIEKAKGLCRYYKPMPKELEGTTAPHDKPNWYDWCNNDSNWGTKWGCYDFGIDDEVIHFTSAWSPISDVIIKMFIKDFPSFHYEYQEETGWGAEMEYENGECIFFNQYDEPRWETIEDSEIKDKDGNVLVYEITKLLEEHPNFEDYGVGYYADYSNDFLGKTLHIAKNNLLKESI